jgi:hypothetical protein
MGIHFNCTICGFLGIPDYSSLHTHLRKNHNMTSNEATEWVDGIMEDDETPNIPPSAVKKRWDKSSLLNVPRGVKCPNCNTVFPQGQVEYSSGEISRFMCRYCRYGYPKPKK